MTDGPLAALLDREAVCDMLYRFAEALDLRDWALYRSVFADEVEIDYTSYRPGARSVMRAEDWVARGRARIDPLDATQHSMSNPRVTVDGDTATCTMYIEAQHVLTRDGIKAQYLIGGRYVDRLIRIGGEWKITAVTLQVRWNLGDPTVVGL